MRVDRRTTVGRSHGDFRERGEPGRTDARSRSGLGWNLRKRRSERGKSTVFRARIGAWKKSSPLKYSRIFKPSRATQESPGGVSVRPRGDLPVSPPQAPADFALHFRVSCFLRLSASLPSRGFERTLEVRRRRIPSAFASARGLQAVRRTRSPPRFSRRPPVPPRKLPAARRATQTGLQPPTS